MTAFSRLIAHVLLLTKLKLVQDNETRWNSFFYAITRALNVKERIQMFCAQYVPPKGAKAITRDDTLEPHHWKQLEHLHDQLESFDEATVMVEGHQTNLADHFQTLDWLLLQLDQAKQRFNELYDDSRLPEYKWLAGAADVSWEKCEKYYNMADQTAAYYTAIIMNPTMKSAWFQEHWGDHPIRSTWLKKNVLPVLKEVWLQEYKGKSLSSSPTTISRDRRSQSPKRYTSCREHKRVKLSQASTSLSETDELDEYLTTDILISHEDHFDAVQYWNDRYHSQPDLAQFALDALAVPPMSDECERLFSSAKLLITDRRSCLKMDIIEANECLRAWYGKPKKGTFDDKAVGIEEGEQWDECGEEGEEEAGEDVTSFVSVE